ncbi:MAG: 2-oxoglutarate dehydrogenase complex dihydrolipoyllysine-residue succinyltransferase [Gammaproteobacteria bacterium]
MSIEVKVPQLPESVADAIVVGWHKSPGDAVERDENLVDLETDKVVLEVPAPASGVLVEIKVDDGATVTSGEILAVLDDTQKAAEPAAAAQEAVSPDAPTDEQDSTVKLSPAVRRLVEEHQLDATKISGTGKDGRLTKSDVISFIDARHSTAQPKPESQKEDQAVLSPGTGNRTDRRVSMTRLRSMIADRMVDAQQTAALLTSFNEVDLGEVMRLRKTYQEKFEKNHGVRIGFMSFFVKAAIEALRKFPVVNASLEGSDIVYHDYYDVGIAVSTERGLMVPVLRNAELMGFSEIESAIKEFALRARDGKITIEELTGGTFSITNGGVFGSLMSTPILNPPQSAILGMHKIQERPMVVDGEIQVRPMMYLALTYDHRLIDGREAVQFLVSIKESLEDPARLLLEI